MSLLGQGSPNDNVHISLASYEISNDAIHDLLSATRSRRIRVTEDVKGGVIIEGLERFEINDESTIQNMLDVIVGSENGALRTAHIVIEIEILVTRLDPKQRSCRRLASKLTFFDLAGTGKSALAPLTTREMASVQSSLMTLRSVVHALTPSVSGKAERQTLDNPAVPYRNSLLTWVLRDALGGNSKTLLVALVSAGVSDADETVSTLSFAHRIGAVRNHAIENELQCSIFNRAVNKEIQTLWHKYEAESKMQTVSPKRKQSRFSMEALNKLNQPPLNYEEEIRVYKERALAAERASKERAEVLWESYQQLQAQLTDTIQHVKEQAIEEAKRAAEGQFVEQLGDLAQHASALLIQV
ncbi:MAG TPA: hypothetical protein VEF04_13980, partial [Blastocatellia bacterium]|nr:hypothetical protein [Blastocatellia bacterium]